MANTGKTLGRMLKNKKFFNFRTPNVYPRLGASLKRGVTRRFNPRQRALRRL